MTAPVALGHRPRADLFRGGAVTVVSFLLGALSFVLLVLGYTAGAQLQGLSYSPVLFGVVGLFVGPFVGVAAAWLRAQGVRGALGTALIPGFFIGEAGYGLTVIADSTRPEYWVAIGAAGVVLLVLMVSADQWLAAGDSRDPGNGSCGRSVRRRQHRPGSGLTTVVAFRGLGADALRPRGIFEAVLPEREGRG